MNVPGSRYAAGFFTPIFFTIFLEAKCASGKILSFNMTEKRLNAIPATIRGIESLYRFIPCARIAVISLSEDSLPNTINVALNVDMGMV